MSSFGWGLMLKVALKAFLFKIILGKVTCVLKNKIRFYFLTQKLPMDFFNHFVVTKSYWLDF